MKRLDRFIGTILFFISIYYVYEALKLPWMVQKSPGAGWLPFWLGILMAILSVLLFFSTVRRDTSADSPVEWPSGKGLINVLVIFGGLVLIVPLLEAAGFALTMFVFILTLLWILGNYKWWICLGTSVLSTAVLWYVFKVWLEVPLPSGLLRFLD